MVMCLCTRIDLAQLPAYRPFPSNPYMGKASPWCRLFYTCLESVAKSWEELWLFAVVKWYTLHVMYLLQHSLKKVLDVAEGF